MVVLRSRPVEHPTGYPDEYEERVRLGDGRRVLLRPIVPTDAPELADAIRSADADTLRGRFLGGPPPLTEAVLKQLTCLDYTTRFAIVAFYRGKGIAIGRYAMLAQAPDGDEDGHVAEVAVAVTPAWRHIGLATAIVERLARRASECGITHFTALFLAENKPVEELAREGNAHVVIAEGAARLYAELPRFAGNGERLAGNGERLAGNGERLAGNGEPGVPTGGPAAGPQPQEG